MLVAAKKAGRVPPGLKPFVKGAGAGTSGRGTSPASRGRTPSGTPKAEKVPRQMAAAKNPSGSSSARGGRGDGIVSGPSRQGAYPAGQTKGAGINARMKKGDPAADAGNAATPGARGRRGGGPVTSGSVAGATGGTRQAGFGLVPGSAVPAKNTGTRKPERAADAARLHPIDRVLASPTHSFASSTIPRGDGSPSSPTLKRQAASGAGPTSVGMSAPTSGAYDVEGPTGEGTSRKNPKPNTSGRKFANPKMASDATPDGTPPGQRRQTPPGQRSSNASDLQTADDLKKPGAPNVLKATAPTVSREMAAPHMGFKAAAAHAAQSAGVSAQAGAAMVAAASQHASSKAKKSNPNLAKVARKGTTKGPGGKFS
jgi:hypothetical protein